MAKPIDGELYLGSGLRYEDYTAFVCYLDKGTLARSGQIPPSPSPPDAYVSKLFSDQCRKFGVGFDNLSKEWEKANDVSGEDEGWPDYLYNPISYTSFGATDSISLLCAHSLDVLPNITSDIHALVSQSSIAFCPRLDQFGLTDDQLKHFISFHELFSNLPPRHIDPPETSCNPSYNESQPLIAVTQIGFSCLAILGPGLLLQQAVYKAIILKINAIVEELKASMEDENSASRHLFEPDDLEEFTCVLTDSLDWANIGLIIHSRNYSLVMTIIAGLQSMAMEDVFEADGVGYSPSNNRLRELVLDPNLSPHTAIAKVMREKYVEDDEKRHVKDDLRDNHVILTTYTTLGMSHKAVYQLNEAVQKLAEGDSIETCNWPPVHGKLSASMICDPMHGHMHELLKEAREVFQTPGVPDDIKEPPELDPAGYIIFSTGRDGLALGDNKYINDPSHPASEPSKSARQHLRSTLHALGLRQLLLNKYFTVTGKKFPGNVRRLSTVMGVPIPEALKAVSDEAYPRDIEKGHVTLARMFHEMVGQVFDPDNGEENDREVEAGGSGTKPPPPLSVSILQEKMKKLGLQGTLCRALSYLFCEYAKALKSPQLLAGVIDLYENFMGLLALIEQLADNVDDSNSRFKRGCHLDANETERLVQLIESVRDALYHRMQVSANTVETSEVAIDLRGGMNQLLESADVALKCGLGLVRRMIAGCDNEPSLDGKYTGVSQTSISPTPQISILNSGGTSNVMVSNASVSIDHLTRAESIHDYLHEAGHLLLMVILQHPDEMEFSSVATELKDLRNKILAEKAGNFSQGIQAQATINLDQETYDEVFVEQLIFLLIFDKDWELFATYYFSSFWLQQVSNSKNETEVICKIYYSLYRCFLALDPFRTADSHDEGEASLYDGSQRDVTSKDLPTARTRFEELIEKTKGLFQGFDETYDDHLRKIFCDRMEKMFPMDKPVAELNWIICKKIFTEYCEKRQDPEDLQIVEKVKSHVPISIEQGYALSRALSEHGTGRFDGYMDSLFIIRTMLREFIRRYYKPLQDFSNSRIHVQRDEQGTVILEKTTGFKWHGLLLDRVKTGFFVTDPKLGKDLLKSRIALIKSMWGISCSLKARRLRLMLYHSFPELVDDPYQPPVDTSSAR